MYTVERFGSYTIPDLQSLDIGTGQSQLGTITTPSGGWDTLGTEQAEQAFPYTVTASGMIVGATAAAAETAWAAMKALRGTRAKLYRRMLDTPGTIQWAWARVTRVPARREAQDRRHVKFEITFDVWSQWRSEYQGVWLLDDGYYLDDGYDLDTTDALDVMASSPHTYTASNGGNTTVFDPIITVTAIGANITALLITKTGETALNYAGTITAGQALVIDCGAYTVKNNGTADYANFSLTSNHVITDWLRLDPGDNTITFTFTGGSTTSTAEIAFWGGWE
jgi:hypothetical protein